MTATSSQVPFEVRTPFPARGAASALRDQVVEYLRQARPQPGSTFLTDADLVEMSNLSRSTVRRALDELQREGWIERHVGRGTFVGPRVAVAGLEGSAVNATEASVVRLAVLVFKIGDLPHDWYTPLVLEGIDSAADEHQVTVELVGDRLQDVEAMVRRVTRSRPDVLVCLSSEPKHAFVLRDAQRLGIHCLVTGTPHIGLGLPAVCEDNRQAMRLAVDHLVAQGHERIGLLMQRNTERWVWDRHEAYGEALASHGLSTDEALVHWVAMDEPVQGSEAGQEAVSAFLDRRKPTAVLAGSYLPMLYLDRLVRSGRLAVPRDLSVVSFEQNLDKGEWLGGIRPTYVRFPLREIGQRVAELARMAMEDEGLPAVSYLPARLVAGESVAAAR